MRFKPLISLTSPSDFESANHGSNPCAGAAHLADIAQEASAFDGFRVRAIAPPVQHPRNTAQVIAADAVGDRGAAAEYGVALAYAVLGAQAQERSA